MPANPFSRREFIKSAVVAGAMAAPAGATTRSPSERLRIGFIGTGVRGSQHIDAVLKLRAAGHAVEAATVCDVYTRNRNAAVARIARQQKLHVPATGDFRELLERPDVDAVLIATPNHWHAALTMHALAAGKHVYCESPISHTLDEAQQVVSAAAGSNRVVQMGCQRTSDARWRAAREFIAAGNIGKVLHAQSEYFRNSSTGQWRCKGLSRDMTPNNVDWPMFLGTEFLGGPELPFDRALFAQWRCYWPFSQGPFSDLFVHRLSELLLATGLRYPSRVVGSGGIFMEYDGREVPDTATLVADFAEGCQLLITSTLCNDHAIEHCIRGHFGTVRFDMSRDGFQFVPQRPQVTRQKNAKSQHVRADKPQDETLAHWQNFLEAIRLGRPEHCHNPPALAAAAVTIATLAADSYRQGTVLGFDPERKIAQPAGPGHAAGWEQLSRNAAPPGHVSGWQADQEHGSRQRAPDYQKLAGPWTDGIDPAV